MAWTAKVTLDFDKPDVGFASATWNEGEADAFTYSRRAKVSGAEAAAFKAEAIAALAVHVERVAQNDSLSATLTTLMNA